jgi:sarcosine oxidase, subunit gamma
MSDPVSALGHATFDGFAKIREIGPLGMLTLRAKPDLPGLTEALAAVGVTRPDPRRMALSGDRGCGWMSPDEYLVILPYDEAAAAMAVLGQKLAGQHHLVANVSDARAVFRIEGAKADQVLKKLMPVDFDRLAPHELRRSRAAQTAAAVWHEGDGFTLVCFRSAASYMMGLLTHSAQPGSDLA